MRGLLWQPSDGKQSTSRHQVTENDREGHKIHLRTIYGLHKSLGVQGKITDVQTLVRRGNLSSENQSSPH